VVVEGPSAAGKTTWCRRHAPHLVGEYMPDGNEPGPSDPVTQASFWTDVNCRRWQTAVGMERIHQTVICDTDPVKLHYSWTLARIGRGDPARFAAELQSTRAAIEQGRLGMADVHLVRIPPPSVLDQQKRSDPTRRRHSFPVHRLLSEPLREWYSALAHLDPARVVWQHPDNGLTELPELTVRPDRNNPTLLDALLDALPPLLTR